MTMSYRSLLSATGMLLGPLSRHLPRARLQAPVRHVLRDLDQGPGGGSCPALGCIPMWRPLVVGRPRDVQMGPAHAQRDRKSTRLNSSHMSISYAVFCLKKKKKTNKQYK